MERLEVSTDVYLPPDEVYEFLVDFPRYARYSTYLDRVEQHGDGDPGTEYDLVFSWWRISYTARSRVTDVDPPRRIDWRTVKDIDARGHWRIEPLPERTGEHEEKEEATENKDGRNEDEGNGRTAESEDSVREEGSAENEGDVSEDRPLSKVSFVVEYDRSSARRDALHLPRFISFDSVLDRALPKIKSEATKVVERVVADLEGEKREVDLQIHRSREDNRHREP